MSIQSAKAPPPSSAARSGAASFLAPVGVLALLFGLSGCGSALSGRFQGTCELGEGTGRFSMPIDHDLVENGEGKITGFGSFRFNDFTFTGEALGERSGEHVLVDVLGEAGGYTLTVRVIGEADEDLTKIDGQCGFVDQGAPFSGAVNMKRAEDEG